MPKGPKGEKRPAERTTPMAPKEPIDTWPPKLLSKDQSAAIGRVTVEWAYLETKIDESIWLLLDQPETVEFDRRLNIKFDARMRLWKELLEKFPGKSHAIQELDTIIDRARDLNGLRDLIVHGRWGTNSDKTAPNGVICWRIAPEFRVTFHPISLKMIDSLPSKIRELNDRLFDFERKHILPLP